jgi:hypothetical protein
MMIYNHNLYALLHVKRTKSPEKQMKNVAINVILKVFDAKKNIVRRTSRVLSHKNIFNFPRQHGVKRWL